MTRRTFFLFALLLVLVMGLQLSPVWAHSELLTAVPAPGATLATAPTEIRLTFSEPLATGSTFQLFDQNFRPISGIAATIDRDSPEELVAATPSLPPGDYTVQWTSVAHDGDTLSGSYSFTLLAEAQNDDRSLIWGVAAAGGLALATGLTWLYRRRRTPAGEKQEKK
jgi:methionine-rich copper-binding protein CopC